ncbi:bifunctional (p)ppGpp synthetase/guanosine-3',5'-bis(diphosphate) 3'-pyrophosphohydrolase [Porphyromonas sp.]|uniref:RelA/SpoT family protein n=1 Tax=Porphyromonas sp. TaxID=1924944 RepID=UPI0026DCD84B|nr:RelA/SpoT family protein [Porphyromonas sp.]MDO4770893.1 RelA/SpoT family protein [Porphyromonas sp.]
MHVNITQQDEQWIAQEFDQLLQDYLASNHRKRTDKIIKAFNLAKSAHAGAKRKSGEPYILHPIAVASICCNEIGLGSTSIAAALLHDVVEDTDYTVQDIRDMFGNSIAVIVDGLTKLSGEILAKTSMGSQDTSAQLENIRRLLLTANRDIRVILIKIADRLHNMRTLSSMPEAKQAKIAAETRLFYSHLAERLGMYHIKMELEDLSLKYDHPEEYDHIRCLIEQSDSQRASVFDKFYAVIKDDLDDLTVRYEIQHRVKSVFSIWNKMKTKNLPFQEIYDIFAIRIVFEPSSPENEYSECFRIYQAISRHFRVKGDRLRDWLSSPKENGYQALHCTVMGPSGQWVEVQIRSRRMHEMAERGLAAHWRYKAETEEVDNIEEKILNNVRALLNNPGPDASEDYETLMYKFSTEEMLIFKKDGSQVRCPGGITVLDFAYLLGDEIGHRCIGAKVNHEMVNIDETLSSGDQVEILTTAKTTPKEEWLYYAKTPQAKRKIRTYLTQEKYAKIKRGKDTFRKFVEAKGFLVSDLIREGHSVLTYPDSDDFYFAINKGEQPLNDDLINDLERVMELFRANGEAEEHQPWESDESGAPALDPSKKKETYTLIAKDGKRNYIRATCCKPIFGEDVHGILNKERQVVVHKKYCPEAMILKASKGDSIVSVAWGPHINSTFGVTLDIEGANLEGFVYNIIATLRSLSIPLTGISFTSSKDRAIGHISIRVPNLTEMDTLVKRLRDENELLKILRRDITRR